ncbi:transcriptional regulator, MarR family [Bacillus sp. JCM 19046]|uniref:DNA-binding MarR family transcriptional regulator n=1 Tax=Shouchella xiaoxiensis TaxID=766895 RepID=A0ABS2STF9_9BACI|nr:winged helix DNA-binding protein [Shouchella xiaoxiensis]MBM7838818.1 DNA-binding MarR family transcriptional regulator [Shouchella xiaoxiensis]GAF15086.1 transcriptional regulator, MarR family [Bacillus sp. JCM 19045]GAF19957.1 transcriptional regulator, MarR family [Bacillus sp. JCM 19046]
MSSDIQKVNELWTDIYYALRYDHKEKMTHQQIRVLQAVDKEREVGVKEIAQAINTSQNTASEHVKRLIEKRYISKVRSKDDERKVLVELTEEGKLTLHRHTSLDEAKLETILQSLKPEQTQLVLTALTMLKDEAANVHNR